MTTKFESFGMLAEDNQVSIYGRAESIRESKTVNVVYSCDLYEFDEDGKVRKIYSHCNSKL